MGEKNCQLLVKLAREAIETAMTKKKLDLTPYKQFSGHHGVFVTLTKDGELRGCIGYITTDEPVYKGVVHAARAAAFDDPRFPRLEPEELGAIRIEVSVLTEPEEVKVKKPEEYLEKIEVGKHGLIIKQGYKTGLLLPQVPTEYGWNIDTYLEQLCKKAGLPTTAWKDKETIIHAFHAKVRCED